jgi:hypothetical protein
LVYYFPLALEHRSSLWLPALYGLGTGLPVVVIVVGLYYTWSFSFRGGSPL